MQAFYFFYETEIILNMKKFGILAFVLLLGMSACEWETIEPAVIILPDEPVSYSAQIAPIFVEVNCISCHGGGISPNLNLDKSYNDLVNGGRVDTDNPEESKLMVKINASHGTAGNMSALQKTLILTWIEEGAKDN